MENIDIYLTIFLVLQFFMFLAGLLLIRVLYVFLETHVRISSNVIFSINKISENADEKTTDLDDL